MKELLDIAVKYKMFTAATLALNLILARLLVFKLMTYTNSPILEAKRARDRDSPMYRGAAQRVRKSIQGYERKMNKQGLYAKAKDKLKKAGYRNEFAAIIYLLLKLVLPLVLYLAEILVNRDPYAVAPCLLVTLVVELGVYRRKKALELKFKRSAYKIYKYLHNQVTSGVKVEEAIHTVHRVIDDRELKEILVRLAAIYSLTLDIDRGLKELENSFDIHEAQTLSVAIKHGIETGDSSEILTGQEDIMFANYFAYIQDQTDACRNRTLLAAVLFSAVIIIMIAIPMFNDAQDAVRVIFIN